MSEAAIKNLLQTYQRALNEANIGLVRSVYAKDAVLIGQPFPTATGIEEIISLYTDFLSKTRLQCPVRLTGVGAKR